MPYIACSKQHLTLHPGHALYARRGLHTALTVDHADAGRVAGVAAALHLQLVVELQVRVADGRRRRTVRVGVVPAHLRAVAELVRH